MLRYKKVKTIKVNKQNVKSRRLRFYYNYIFLSLLFLRFYNLYRFPNSLCTMNFHCVQLIFIVYNEFFTMNIWRTHNVPTDATQ